MCHITYVIKTSKYAHIYAPHISGHSRPRVNLSNGKPSREKCHKSGTLSCIKELSVRSFH